MTYTSWDNGPILGLKFSIITRWNIVCDISVWNLLMWDMMKMMFFWDFDYVLEPCMLTTSKCAAVDDHILWVLQMNSISVGAITGWWNVYIKHLNVCAWIKLQMCLLAVLNCYSCHCYTITSIEPQSLNNRTHQNFSFKYKLRDLLTVKT